jgi:hypothetical protein
MLSSKFSHIQCFYDERHKVVCHFAECRGALVVAVVTSQLLRASIFCNLLNVLRHQLQNFFAP